MAASGYVWPIVEARIKFVKPTTFGQRLRVKAAMTEYENRLKIKYTISDYETEECVTKAQTIQVAVDKASGEMRFCSPQVFLDKVRTWLAG